MGLISTGEERLCLSDFPKNGGKKIGRDLLNFCPSTSRLKNCLKINAQQTKTLVVNHGESPLSVSLYRLYQIIPHHFRSSAHFLGPTLVLFSPRTCSGANCKRRQSSATEDRLSDLVQKPVAITTLSHCTLYIISDQ